MEVVQVDLSKMELEAHAFIRISVDLSAAFLFNGIISITLWLSTYLQLFVIIQKIVLEFLKGLVRI
jgi:hypothetical protein